MHQQGQLIHQRYRIVRQIGRGGMGSVYEAIDERLGKTVALKETFATEQHVRDAFIAEARLLASLNHPALPDVSDYFAEDGSQILVMDYIAGDDLDSLLQQRGAAFPLDKVLAWADELLEVLEFLHTQQPAIIHRDIKPQNIKLTPDGRLYLIDFGLAKGQAGTIVTGYTVSYAPPEQVQQQSPDERGDLYSLSATLLHLLTNTDPQPSTTRLAALALGEEEPQQPAYVLNPDVPRPISDVLERGMAIKPADRYASARELHAALRQASAAAAAAPSTGATQVITAAKPTPTVVIPSPAGTAAPAPAPVPPAPSPQPASGKQRKGPSGGVIVGVVIVLLLIAGVGGTLAFLNLIPGVAGNAAGEPAAPPAEVDETAPPPEPTAGPTAAPAAPAVPPLTNQIVFVSDRDGSQDIFVMNADGSDVTNLTSGAVNAAAPAISPDGTRIAFASDDDIFVMNADGSDMTNLTDSPNEENFPTWSPDGTQLAFVQDDVIYIMSDDGADLSAITSEAAGYRDLDWSPDGTQLAFTLDDDIYRIGIDGSAQTNLTGSPDARDQKPAWSPDGTQLAFASDPDPDLSSFDIYVMEANGRGLEQLTTDESIDDDPIWSPDGAQIAFRTARNRDQEIYVMNADGSEQTNLTESPDSDDTAPVWSPE